ncbi:MAG TPA: hypothetical protein VFT51_00750 [Bacillales bacterium]|nr:hypothetical protein [Bacillales bacterium]
MNLPLELPDPLQSIIADVDWEQDKVGMSEASVYKLVRPSDGETFYGS